MKKIRIIKISDLYGVQVKKWYGWRVCKLYGLKYKDTASLSHAFLYTSLYFTASKNEILYHKELCGAMYNKNYEVIDE